MSEADVTERDRFELLFVCSGNTCRSPLAEALARRELAERGLDDRVGVRSAGTGAMDGAQISEGSLQAGASVGLDLSDHRSRPLTAELVADTDLILTMGMGHLHRVLDLGGEGRVSVISAFAEGSDEATGWGVPDPFGGGQDIYMETLRALEELVGRSIDRIETLITSSEDP